MKSSILLAFDAAINFILGILLLLTIPYPDQIPKVLDIPMLNNAFYASLLGAVLFGIGLALVYELRQTRPGKMGGLGLGGAIIINLTGGVLLIGWLIFGDLNLPRPGLYFLWAIGLVLFTISAFELIFHFRNSSSS